MPRNRHRNVSLSVLMRDPPPLPPECGPWSCDYQRDEYMKYQALSKVRMPVFDRGHPIQRDVERAVGDPNLTVQLLNCGVRSFGEAEAFIRRMQEQAQRHEMAMLSMGDQALKRKHKRT